MYYDALRSRVRRATAARKKRRAAQELIQGIDIYQHIAPVYAALHRDIEAAAHTVYNLPGGRGSGKSSFVALEIVNAIMRDPTGQSNAIVFRRYANTMRESVFSQITWAIDTLGVSELWRSRLSPMGFVFIPTGAEIIFRGLDDPSKLKSIKPTRGFFRFIWLEEFSELPGPNFVRNVMQSVQRGGDVSTVFRSFNPPISRSNWANLYIQEPDARAITLHTDYTMLPPSWLGEAFIYEAERLREVNPAAYQHEYMGEATGTGGEVFQNITAREITNKEIESLSYFFQGVDFGFAVDPFCFIRLAYDQRTETITFVDEIYRTHYRNRDAAADILRRGYNTVPTYCDSAEPKSIVDLRDAGLDAKQAYKAPGCVAYRVKWMQHRTIVIDPKRTPNAYREFSQYEYERDRDGNYIADLPDKNNHAIDSAAYSLTRVIWKRTGGGA